MELAVTLGPDTQLTVTAENRSAETVTLSLPDRCPAGLVELDGLGDGYDYYGTCNQGACPGPRSPTTFSLAPGERRTLATTTIHPGGDTCNGPLPPGVHSVEAVAPQLAVPTCTIPASLEVADTEAPPDETPPPPEPTARSTSSDFHACQHDGDCEIYCPEARHCCGFPCGCRNAINRAHRDAFTREYEKKCLRPPKCPAVDCLRNDADAAKCNNGRCVAINLGATSSPF